MSPRSSLAWRRNSRTVSGRVAASASGVVATPLALVRDPLRVALFVLTILEISRVHQHFPLLSKFRPALILVIASVGYAYLNPRYLARGNVLRFWTMRNVAILGVLSCLSAAFGLSLGQSALFILDSYSKTLAYTFLIAVSIRHVRDLYTFVWAYVIACGILAYFSLFVFGLSKGSGYAARLDALYTYDSNDVCVVILVGLALTLLLVGVLHGWRRWLLLIVLLGIGATIARSGSRGGFIGFVAAAAAAVFLVNGLSLGRRLGAVTLVLFALSMGAPPGYWRQMNTIINPEHDYNVSSIDGRKELMLRGVGYLRQYPVFGLGIDNFGRAECTMSPKTANFNGPMKCSAPHNSYLQAGTELGIPGFLIWVSLVIGGILSPLLLRRRLPKSWRHGSESERFIYGATSFFAVAMVAFAVTSFFLSFAWTDQIYLMTALLTGLYVAAHVQMQESGGDRRVAELGFRTPSRSPGWRVMQSAWRFPPTVHAQLTAD